MSKAHRIVLVAFVLLLTFSTQDSNAWGENHEEWTVTAVKGGFRFLTHGSVIWGHRFGFIKKRGSCNTDMLWIIWSTYDKQVLALKKIKATLELTVGGTSIPLTLDMYGPVSLLPGLLWEMAFTNFLAGPKLIEVLSAGDQAIFKVVAPKSLIEVLGVHTETFSLIGFVASRKAARMVCEGG